MERYCFSLFKLETTHRSVPKPKREEGSVAGFGFTMVWFEESVSGMCSETSYVVSHLMFDMTNTYLQQGIHMCIVFMVSNRRISFQNIPMDWKSDPLDRAGRPSPKAPPKVPQGFILGVALRYR